MCKNLIYLVCLALVMSVAAGARAQSFSLLPTDDGELGNDEQIGPDQNSGGGSGMAFRDIDVRRRVSYVSYDVSELLSGGQSVANVSFSNYGHDSGTVLVYGVLEEFDNIDETTITWNTAPGVQNDPAPALGSPVALDYADLTDELMSFISPARGVRSSTEVSQALTDFVNSDTDGVVTFIFAPPAGQNNGILRTKEMGADGGTLLEGNLTGLPQKALEPNPADEATDVPRDVVLSWTPGGYADKHDVYLGTSFDDVNQATATADPAGVYMGRQDANVYPANGMLRLEIGRTYYWRVDEVVAPPDNTIFKGTIWQFTVEPFAYAIPGESIIAAASSSDEGKGPENTVNGSGLDAGGLLHNNDSEGQMWLSSKDGDQPTWIEYDLGKVYRLHEMWVWNFNESLESVIGLGFKDVTIEYSANGTDYATLGTTHEFNQAPGTADYAHNTTVDLSGVEARYIKLTVNSNWGGILAQYGLSEVRFFYVPIRARAPKPAAGATDVARNVTLNWTAGREAAEHNIYFSDDEQAVIDGTVPVMAVAETSYGPLSLDVGKTYYWRVDEVNDPTVAPLEGDIWSFTTTEFLVVDDFETYTDDDVAGQAIWQSWIDGFGVADNGAQVGYLLPPYAERTIVHSGLQSMPFAYDNTSDVTNSEAARVLTTQRDWTEGGVAALSLWFRGNPASVGSFIEAPAGTYTITATGTDIWDVADEFHYAFKTLTGTGTIEAQVLSVQNTDPWAKAGVMIRETLDAGSKFAAVYITPGNGCRFQTRTDTDIAATSDTTVATTEQMAITAPYWVKMDRDFAGNFRAYYSSNGTTWQSMSWNPQNISMSSNVYVGLVVTSHSSGVTCEAKFSNVRTTGTVSGEWAHQDVGLASNDAQPLYVEVSSATGTPVVVAYDDPDAAQIDTWREWVIPLQDLADQGINLTDVDKIAVGLGSKGGASASGGSGMMYFDDIRLYP
jgi:hypothetical protein